MSGHLVAEIDAGAVRANIEAIRRRIDPSCELCAVVKANAYGHGIDLLLPVLSSSPVDRLAVAQMPEAFTLRELGWTGPILCFGAPLAWSRWSEARDWASEAVLRGIECTVGNRAEADLLSRQAVALDTAARVHVKVDSGMGRMGVRPEDVERQVADIAALPAVEVEGVYTHLATADEAGLDFAQHQLGVFRGVLGHLDRAGLRVHRRHAANSAAVFRLPEAGFDLVRPGLGLYGYWGGPAKERPAELRPCMRVVSEIVAIRQLPAGHDIGYGRTFTTRRDSTVGLVPVGYADGYRRQLGNQAVMTLDSARGRPARTVPVLGRVSMDMTTVDLTEAGDVRIGDRVIVVDNDPAAPNSVESLAATLDTIPYEISCLLGNRVQRMLVGERPPAAPWQLHAPLPNEAPSPIAGRRKKTGKEATR